MAASPFAPTAGTTGASTATPRSFAPATRPVGQLVDCIDPKNGELASLRQVRHPVDAAIVFQFKLQRGSGAAVMDQGQNFRAVRKNDDTAEEALRLECKRVLRPFVERQDIAVERIDVKAGAANGDIGAAYVLYINARTGRRVRVSMSGDLSYPQE